MRMTRHGTQGFPQRLFFLTMLLCASVATAVCHTADSVFVERLLQQYAGKDMTPAQLVTAMGREFVGKPYVGGTLEVNAPGQEQLVVNTREVDCTTFVDQVLALALTARDGDTRFAAFCQWLTTLRYRGGTVNGYASRLHYFTDFVADNKPLFDLVPAADGTQGEVRRVTLSFMSTHTDSYPSLRGHPETVALIREVEQRYADYPVRYIPKLSTTLYSLFREGDVVALLTTTEGLDVSHLGIVVKENDELHLLHASSAAGKVVVDPRPLSAMLAPRKSCPGIRAIRLKTN